LLIIATFWFIVPGSFYFTFKGFDFSSGLLQQGTPRKCFHYSALHLSPGISNYGVTKYPAIYE